MIKVFQLNQSAFMTHWFPGTSYVFNVTLHQRLKVTETKGEEHRMIKSSIFSTFDDHIQLRHIYSFHLIVIKKPSIQFTQQYKYY